MNTTCKIFLCCLILFTGINSGFSQTACCAKGSKAALNCKTNDATAKETTAKACCATKAKETTSGCTPSNCRGAKTKFGEAKVISELRQNLVALKATMEKHEDYSFSGEAISVHDIIGETDEESLTIISEQVAIIQPEIVAYTNQEFPTLEESDNKAIQVKHLQDRISTLIQILN